ncbi:uncharacterized protein LOC120915125 [Rana temporaria]|uniref:uncharacterized protein LOC120915125 n=1 Tax=Rana temporaria TaxID=8407 RepID=UPI001AAC8CD6|nr:uncharacterized protein LOC120915125 [Rana temporaria]
MASSKTAGTLADLQESLTRVRQQYGLLPRAGWDDLIAMVSYEKAISAQQRNKNLARPFLPSLTDDISRVNVEHRKGDKNYYTIPTEHNQNDRKRIDKRDILLSKNVLQKNMEWEKTKPKTDQGLNKYFVENQHSAWDFVESLVSEILRDEILPDVVIEALTNNPSKISWMPTKKYHGTELSKSLISEGSLTYFSQIFLDELINDLLKELCNHAHKMEVQDFVGDYLMESTLHDFFDELITSIIQTELSSLVEELNKETEYDKWLENFIQSITDMEVRNIVTTVLTESDDQFSALLKNQIVATANKHIVDMFILDDLLGLIGTHEPLMFEKDSSGCLMESIILDVLLKEYVTIQKVQQTTFQNCPAKHFHQDIFNELALDVILTELNILLVEDMEDIFEYEHDIELG